MDHKVILYITPSIRPSGVVPRLYPDFLLCQPGKFGEQERNRP